MKKYLVLIIVTTILTAVVICIPFINDLTARDTETAYVFCDDYTDSVVCSGKIINNENISIVSPYSFVVEKVCVVVGDCVTEGETLITIDKQATANLLITYFQDDISSVMEQIPTEIKAEQDGIISEINTTSGSAVTSGQDLMKISGDNSLQVMVNINENVISNIKVGQFVQIKGNAFGNLVYTGILTKLADQAKTIISGTSAETVVEGYIDIDNPNSLLKSGYTVKVTIITNTVENAVLVPYDAVIQDDDNNKYVYKIVDCWAIKQFFQESYETSKGIVVSSGVNLNDLVAVNIEDTNTNINYFRVKTGNKK